MGTKGKAIRTQTFVINAYPDSSHWLHIKMPNGIKQRSKQFRGPVYLWLNNHCAYLPHSACQFTFRMYLCSPNVLSIVIINHEAIHV